MNKALFLYLFFIGLIPSLFAQKDYCDYKDKTAISAQRKVVKLYNKAEKLRQKKKKKTRQGMSNNTKYYTKESPNYKKRKVGQGG